MPGTFLLANEAKSDALDRGRVRRVCDPARTGAAQLAIVEATFNPGKGHDFHKHPRQEEVIFVMCGQIEQWVDREKRLLREGDAAFIPPGVVHASFNVSGAEARILAIFGPSIGDGFETIEMAGEAPWSGLAKR